MGEVVVGFGKGGIDHGGNLKGGVGTGDDPKVADRDVGAFDEVSRSGHRRGFPWKYKGLAVGWIPLRARVSAKGGTKYKYFFFSEDIRDSFQTTISIFPYDVNSGFVFVEYFVQKDRRAPMPSGSE